MQNHIWVLRILADLRDYSELNKLHALKTKIDEVYNVAQDEIGLPT